MADHFVSEDTYNDDLLGKPADYSPAERAHDRAVKLLAEQSPERKATEIAGRKETEVNWQKVDRDNDPADGENKQGWDSWKEGQD